FHTEQAGRIVRGTFNYYAAAVDGRYYVPLSDTVVVAARAQIGAINAVGTEETNVPFAKKYFLGGSTSVRGWDRFEISPLSSGLPIGGDSMLALSAELRAPLRGNFGAVFFIDAGNVWAGPSDFNPTALRSGER